MNQPVRFKVEDNHEIGINNKITGARPQSKSRIA